jgi:UDP-N-acetylglucosamine--N-acetylmuramyl-(pentapeptide) pyrophosphoryl-undecaprenol N-acetylglucosamine transferase
MAGGGTGGHVIPALAIARALRDGDAAEVRFVGTARGLETRLVPEAGFPLELIKVGQLKGVSLATRARTLADLPLGILRCVRLLREFRPDVVVGVGGYASGPAMMAAILLRVPTLAYEPNAVPGLANRLVGKRVSAAAVAFEATAGYFRKAVVTGVPVREAIFTVQPKPEEEAPRLLITAGSQGARVFNETLPGIAPELLERVRGLTIVHQAGAANLEKTRAAYEANGVLLDPAFGRVSVAAFLDDMVGEYRAADLVLCRSGSTVAELAAAGRPSLLVPFPQAADDHQRKNAEVLADAGAAVMMLQANLTPDRLCAELVSLLNDRPRLRAMGERARGLARPGALAKIAEMLRALARR